MNVDLSSVIDGKEATKSHACPCTLQAYLDLSAPFDWTASEGTTATDSVDYKHNSRNSLAYENEPYSLAHVHELPEEERDAVKAAIIQLRYLWHDAPFIPDTTVCSNVLPHDTRDLLLDTEWRNASIQGKS